MNARRGGAAGGPSAERHAATLQGPPVLPRLTHCAARRATPPRRAPAGFAAAHTCLTVPMRTDFDDQNLLLTVSKHKSYFAINSVANKDSNVRDIRLFF